MNRIYEALHAPKGELSFLVHTLVQKREGRTYIHYTAGALEPQALRRQLDILRKQINRWFQDRTLQKTSESGGVYFYQGDGFTLAMRPLTTRPRPDAPHHFSVILPREAPLDHPFSALLQKKPKPKVPAPRSTLPAQLPQAKRSKRSGDRVRRFLDEST